MKSLITVVREVIRSSWLEGWILDTGDVLLHNDIMLGGDTLSLFDTRGQCDSIYPNLSARCHSNYALVMICRGCTSGFYANF